MIPEQADGEVNALRPNGTTLHDVMRCLPEVGALSDEDAVRALRDPALASGVVFQGDALYEIVRVTQGYPYFLQEWGY